MRRKDREMDAKFALELFDKAPYVTLSMVRADGSAYAVPLTLARTDDQTFYFHCAKEGDKLDALRENPQVCLSAVTRCQPTVGPKDGSFTMQFRSAIAFGRAQLVEDDAERVEALRAICTRWLPHHMDAFQSAIERSLHRTAVVRITLTEPPTGKRKEYGQDGHEMR